MMEDESEEVISVDRSTYKDYYKRMGGAKVFITVIIFAGIYLGAKMLADYMIGKWAGSTS